MDGQVLEFGVSGLLRFSNLIMFDRQTESWWQEFGGEAIAGEMAGNVLELLPLSMVSWKEFKEAFPEGKVLSGSVEGRNTYYPYNPYSGYDTSVPFLYDGPRDDRLPTMARVVGIIMNDEALAVPFSVLEREHVVHSSLADGDLVVFFKKGTASALDTSDITRGRDVGSTGVFDPNLEGRRLTFGLVGDDIVDEETGSAWNLLGQATSGPLKGKSLSPILHRGAPFWFSWAAFRPDTMIYEGE